MLLQILLQLPSNVQMKNSAVPVVSVCLAHLCVTKRRTVMTAVMKRNARPVLAASHTFAATTQNVSPGCGSVMGTGTVLMVQMNGHRPVRLQRLQAGAGLALSRSSTVAVENVSPTAGDVMEILTVWISQMRDNAVSQNCFCCFFFNMGLSGMSDKHFVTNTDFKEDPLWQY